MFVCEPLDAARRDFALDLECAYELAVDRPSFRISKKSLLSGYDELGDGLCL
jgi:hypothetical protein